jgi:hypothetical protein
MKSQISKIRILATGLFVSLSALSFAQSTTKTAGTTVSGSTRNGNGDVTSKSVKSESSVQANGDTTKSSKSSTYKKTTKTVKPVKTTKKITKTTTVTPL